MNSRSVKPTTGPGGWTLEGGYRRRAERSLLLLEQKVQEFRDRYRKAYQTPPAAVPPELRETLDEIQHLSDAVVIFAAMAVESFLNFYGVVRLGEDFYSRNYERLRIGAKLSALLATCCGVLLDTDDEITKVVACLFDRRNSLLHPKTRELKPGTESGSASPLVPPARHAVEDMRKFFELFFKYDQGAQRWADL